MKVYRLTQEGKRVARVPNPNRCPVLDHLYEFKTASRDELLALSRDARSKLSEYARKGYVEELNGD